DKQAVITFDAREFRSDGRGELDLDDIKLLDRDKVDAACPRLGEVQERTDLAAEVVSRTHGYLSPTEFGTAVHTNLKRQIGGLNDRAFRAEVSYLKNREETYGRKDSIRIDVLEKVGDGTVCVRYQDWPAGPKPCANHRNRHERIQGLSSNSTHHRQRNTAEIMITVSQVREVVQPLLQRNPDLELVGRLVVTKPLQHILRGIYVDRSLDRQLFVPSWAVMFLFEPSESFSYNWGGRLYDRAHGAWDVTNSATSAVMCEEIEKEALP